MKEPNVNNRVNLAENWITEEELKERYPKLWKAAKEKVQLIEADWTPELREELSRLRGR